MKKFLIILTVVIGISVIMYDNQENPTVTATPVPTKSEAVTPKPTIKPTTKIIEQEEKLYIGNKNSRKFHNPDCYSLPIEKNRVEFSSRDAAINKGYSPCGNCNP